MGKHSTIGRKTYKNVQQPATHPNHTPHLLKVPFLLANQQTAYSQN